jgi:polysaccharide pyruvyl transferase WcaK-like protein
MKIIVLLLQKLYEMPIFPIIIHGIWTIINIINIIKLFIFCLSNKNFIYHYGIFGKYRNIGDNLLYYQIEELFDNNLNCKNIWYNRLALGEISLLEVLLINNKCSILIVGGHGLLMPESNKNNNSGWGFNIKIGNLKKIKIPIIFFAIGYNVFRGQDRFYPIFREHLNECIKKSIFFGLRNYGSIEKIKNIISNDLCPKIKYQPCPTTIQEISENIVNGNYKDNKIAISVAFNKIKKRYNNINDIISKLVDYGKYMQNNGFEVYFFGHHLFDVFSKYAKCLKENGFSVLPLYGKTKKEIYKIYRNNKIIISMRGHGLMIPFGLSIPTISLTNQDKQKWFLETIGYEEWNLEINDDFYKKLLNTTFEILSNYNTIMKNLILKKEDNKIITKNNMDLIILELKNGYVA